MYGPDRACFCLCLTTTYSLVTNWPQNFHDLDGSWMLIIRYYCRFVCFRVSVFIHALIAFFLWNYSIRFLVHISFIHILTTRGIKSGYIIMHISSSDPIDPSFFSLRRSVFSHNFSTGFQMLQFTSFCFLVNNFILFFHRIDTFASLYLSPRQKPKP